MRALRRKSIRLALSLASSVPALAYVGCSGESANDVGPGTSDESGAGANDAAVAGDGGTLADGGSGGDSGISPIAISCVTTTTAFAPNDCPAITGTHGQASFCFRPQWPGVTSVDVYLSQNGQASDWSASFLTLTDDGTGTFTGTKAIPDNAAGYPYVFKVKGDTDGVMRAATVFLDDQRNPSFMPPPTGSPLPRSVSVLTVPQTQPTIYHVRGKVAYAGAPQPCYGIDLEVGELLKPGGAVLSEHGTANYAESRADGTFDFPVAAGQQSIVVKYPFYLAIPDGGYPDPYSTPSVGTIRGGYVVGSSDVTLDPADIEYPESDYAMMTPTGGSATLPVTFTWSLSPGSSKTQASIAGTNIAGNDPLWASGFGTATTASFDGGYGNGGGVTSGKTYYWGAWQQFKPSEDGGIQWTSQSLLFPIDFP